MKTPQSVVPSTKGVLAGDDCYLAAAKWLEVSSDLDEFRKKKVAKFQLLSNVHQNQ